MFPAEWYPQSGIMIAWPHPDTDWRENLADVEHVYCELVRQVSEYEKVLLLCMDEPLLFRVKGILDEYGIKDNRIDYRCVPYNDTWTRDFGPLSILKNGQPQLLNFQFNGWGNKFRSEQDNQVNHTLYAQGTWPGTCLHDISYTLEGGSIETDGCGTLLTTSACLLNKNRNGPLSREAVEKLLMKNLGINRVFWLEYGGLAGDDTDGHIDTLARFCDPETIAYMTCNNPGDENYHGLSNMEQELKDLRTKEGRPYTLIPLQLPQPVYDRQGRRLPASYANFLITNGPILMPVYQDTMADQRAADQLAAAFPGREILTIDCKSLIVQHGSLHCMTMQITDKVLTRNSR